MSSENQLPTEPKPTLSRYIAENFKSILLDALIVYGLTFVCGAIVGALSSSLASPMTLEKLRTPNMIIAIALSNSFASILGFFIVGFRAARNQYWRHLFLVALFVWIASLINVVFFGIPFARWFFGIFAMALFMGIGGGLRLLARSPKITA